MIQRPSQEEIERGLAEFKGDYKRLLRNITNCLEFDYKAICSLRTLLADSKEDIAEIKRTIRPYVVDLIYVLILDEKDLNSGEYGVDEEQIHRYRGVSCGLLHPSQENIGRRRITRYVYEAHQRRPSLFRSRIYAALYVASTF